VATDISTDKVEVFMLPSAPRTYERLSSSLNARTVLILLVLFTACRGPSPAPAISVGALLREYQHSRTGVRQKYDGKEISVRGLVLSAATLPLNSAEQGSVWLQESDWQTNERLGCWFSGQQAADFSKIRGGQHVTIKGIFNGEAGVELKFCHVVKVE